MIFPVRSLTNDNLYPDFKSVYRSAADTVIRECFCIIYVCKWKQNYLVCIVNQRLWNTSMLYNINFNNFQEIVGINKGHKFPLYFLDGSWLEMAMFCLYLIILLWWSLSSLISILDSHYSRLSYEILDSFW